MSTPDEMGKSMANEQPDSNDHFKDKSILEFTTFPRIPTQMPFQAVFMRGGAGPACMDDLVVDQ
jgi:hypothetical protein